MDVRDQRLTGNFTIDEAEDVAAFADREHRTIASVVRLAVLRLLRESAQSSTAEEVEK